MRRLKCLLAVHSSAVNAIADVTAYSRLQLRLRNKHQTAALETFRIANGQNSSAGRRVAFAWTAAAVGGVIVAGLADSSTTAHAELTPEEGHVFLNWSASHECHPVEFYMPKTLEEVELLLKKFHHTGRKLRCMGAGVSPNGLGFSSSTKNKHKASNEALMSMAMFDKILEVDQEKCQVTVEAGIVVGNLLDKLRDEHDMTMLNVASIRDQQLAGICQSGSHGTGATISPIDDHIVQMEIISPAKGKMTLSATQNPELFALTKCGLGALGVVTKIKLQCTPKYYLAEKTTVMTVDEIRLNHIQWLRDYQHLRYMWIPYTDSVVVIQCARITKEEALQNASRYKPAQHSMDERLAAPRQLYLELANGQPEPDYLQWGFTKLRDKLLEFNPLDKHHVIRVNQAEKQFWLMSEGYRVGLSDDIITFDCGGQQHVQEVAFATRGTIDIDFVAGLLKRIDAENIPAHAPIEQRWTARSTSAMSPAASDDPAQVFSWVGVILYLPTADETQNQMITKKFLDYYAIYRDYMVPYNATEHWAKIEWPADASESQKIRDRMQKRFPLELFKRARDELDPEHILSNDIVDKLCASGTSALAYSL